MSLMVHLDDLWLRAVALAVFAASPAAAGEGGLCDVVALQAENDEAGGTDRYYTGALRLACTTSPPRWVDGLPLLPAAPGANIRKRFTYSLGQSVFTPDDLAEAAPIEDDHPYAGWLYLGFGLDQEVTAAADRKSYLDRVELQLGVVGPYAGAEEAQRFAHDILDATDPAGWGNQLDNEPGINLFVSRQWTGAGRFALADTGLSLDATPVLGAALGNVHLFGAAGLTIRFGAFGERDHGPSLIRPGIGGADGFAANNGFSAYVFGGAEGRVVGRNIFLDGNSFQDDGPSVAKERLVGEARIGVAVTVARFRLAYTQVMRSPEFADQGMHSFGSVTLALAL